MGFKLGILISGNGSNMLNIINASKKSIINSKVATVVSNNPKALGIQKAKDNRINFEEKIGYVPQNIFLINETIIKNIAFGIPENEIDIKKILKSIDYAQLGEMVKNLPNGLNCRSKKIQFLLVGLRILYL